MDTKTTPQDPFQGDSGPQQCASRSEAEASHLDINAEYPHPRDTQLNTVIRDYTDPTKTLVITSVEYEDSKGYLIYYFADYYE